MRKTTKNDNTHVIAILVFYDERKLPIFNILGVVVYCFLEKYVCIDYLCLQKKRNYICNRVFEDTLFDELSLIGIPEILLIIVSCYGFIQEVNTTLICTCRIKIVSY